MLISTPNNGCGPERFNHPPFSQLISWDPDKCYPPIFSCLYHLHVQSLVHTLFAILPSWILLTFIIQFNSTFAGPRHHSTQWCDVCIYVSYWGIYGLLCWRPIRAVTQLWLTWKKRNIYIVDLVLLNSGVGEGERGLHVLFRRTQNHPATAGRPQT
jgi:hypothetical protein